MASEFWVVAAMALWAGGLFVSERLWPLRRRERSLLRRLGVNAGLAASAFAAVTGIVRPVVDGVLAWTGGSGFGVIAWLGLGGIAELALGFVLMDLSFYYWHRLNHQVPWLWRFHVVHHVDPDLDVTTALRFHFGEIALSSVFRLAQIGLIGLSPAAFALYEIAFQAGTLFHHSNVRLPLRLERALNWLLVTPRMHGVHHSRVRSETHSNYSVVLSVWDRLHGSLWLSTPQAAIRAGVPAYSWPQDNGLGQTLSMPFREQRRDWMSPTGQAMVRREQVAEGPSPMAP